MTILLPPATAISAFPSPELIIGMSWYKGTMSPAEEGWTVVRFLWIILSQKEDRWSHKALFLFYEHTILQE
jgi:hypothetical protein